jgi:hypothetical protein
MVWRADIVIDIMVWRANIVIDTVFFKPRYCN